MHPVTSSFPMFVISRGQRLELHHSDLAREESWPEWAGGVFSILTLTVAQAAVTLLLEG